MTPGSGYGAWAEHHLLVKTCEHFVWSMSESRSKCAKASENASSVSSAHRELVSSQLVLCEEQWSCAAPGAHTSANCAAVTACSQAFPYICPGGICVSAPAQLCWLAPGAGSKGSSLQPPPAPACTGGAALPHREAASSSLLWKVGKAHTCTAASGNSTISLQRCIH